MFAKILVAFLFLGVAHQGLAQSPLSTIGSRNSYDVYDAIEGAVNVIPYLGFSSGLSRGFDYCKTLFHTVAAELKGTFVNISGLTTDAVHAFQDYKLCNNKLGDEVKACKEAVRTNYIESVKNRFQNIKGGLKAAVLSAIKLPTCMFNQN